jgi:hypothetical protein
MDKLSPLRPLRSATEVHRCRGAHRDDETLLPESAIAMQRMRDLEIVVAKANIVKDFSLPRELSGNWKNSDLDCYLLVPKSARESLTKLLAIKSENWRPRFLVGFGYSDQIHIIDELECGVRCSSRSCVAKMSTLLNALRPNLALAPRMQRAAHFNRFSSFNITEA